MKNILHNFNKSTYLLLLLGLFFSNLASSQATYYAVANTAWNVSSTWSLISGGTGGDGVPGILDTVIIGEATARAVTIPSGYTASAATLTIGSASTTAANSLTLSAADAVLNVSGNVIINKPSATGTNSLTINTGTANITGSVTNASSNNAKGQILLTTGALTIGGDLVLNGTTAANNVVTLGTGTINLAGALTATNATLTGSAGSTLNFNGADQTVTYLSALTTVNLTLSGSGTKTLQAGMVAVRNLTLSGTASTTTVANLAVSGALNIGNGATLNIGGFTLAVTGATTVGGGTSGTLNFNSATNPNKTFTGLVTINAGASWNETAAITPIFVAGITNNGAVGTILTSTGVHTINSSTCAFTGPISIQSISIGGGQKLYNSGTLTVSSTLVGGGDLINNAGATINLYGSSAIGNLNNQNGGAGGTINLYSTLPVASGINILAQSGLGAVLNIYGATYPLTNSLNISATVANTVNYAGSVDQPIKNVAYYNLTTSGSGIKTWTLAGSPAVKADLLIGSGTTLSLATSGGSLIVTGTTTVNGTFSNVSTATGTKTFTGAVTVNSGGVWDMTAAASTITFSGGITSNGTSFNNGTGAAAFSLDQSLSGATNMTFGGTVTPASTKTLTNNNSGTVTIGNTLTLTGNFTQGSNTPTLVLSAATPISGAGTFNASTNPNTVSYSGAAQAVKTVTYSNLLLSGSGAKTITTGTSVAANLSISGTATASMGTGLNISVGSLTLGGSNKTSGTWGSTLSAPTNIDDVYFASTTGYLTVLGLPTSTTWNGSAWSNEAPTSSLEAIIAGTYNTTTNGAISAKKLTINTGRSLTIKSGTNVTVQDEVINNAGTTGLTIENNANLIQVNNTLNTGSAMITRNSNALSRLDYTMWSSPVDNQILSGFSPNTTPTRFYTYNSSTNLYNTVNPSTSFQPATGYLIRMPNTAVDAPATETFSGVFSGVPNNGNIGLNSLPSDAYVATGNPYPSTISANDFLIGNTTDGTLYFWRKTNGVANSNSAYATYTTLGGTAAGNVAPNDIIPNGIIQVGQGFIVKTGVATTTLDFTNTMRRSNNNGQILKTKNVVEKDRIWLNLTNATGVFSQALVGYMTGATQGVDNGIDGKYFNDNPVALTSNINNEDYTIQGRALPFDSSDVVPLNFKTDVAGNYAIAIDHVDGLFAEGQDVYLVDNTTGTETNLKTDAYNFTATSGTDNARFSLKYQKTLKMDASVFNENTVTVYKNKGTLYVNSGSTAINNIKVFDIQGRLISEQKNVKANSAAIKDLKATQQVLIVKITDEDKKVVSKKVVN